MKSTLLRSGRILALTLILCTFMQAAAKENKAEGNEEKSTPLAKILDGLRFRSIGPALTSGRIGDLAVDPRDPARYFVAVASGGVWLTENAGTTFEPVFDKQGVYSIGCVTIDPNNPHTVWVGTGENNSQRSVGWGDGVYLSRDGGRTWENKGLKRSEHIAKIIVEPGNPEKIWVASQGPLWGPGGDRGVFRSSDGGNTWENVLYISENTGVTDLVMDPRDPRVLYAASYQRRRHVWTLINGGPESGIYKTTDGGSTWRKLEQGLPKEDLGRIGLAISPTQPDILYAIIEATDNGGFYRSATRGESWEKRNDYQPTSPQYYSEIVCDPLDPDKVYSLDTYTQVTEDGGKTFRRLGLENRHVDDHALWIDPANTLHLLIGGDGGIYETWDEGSNWHYKSNLPVTQFYRVSVDNAMPFYHVYGGTQDNNTIGGPSRTLNAMGIRNADWFITKGGDGFETVIDPVDPNIVYSQSQYGWLVRYDKRSGEAVGIKPMEPAGEAPWRWNWDAPLLLSNHDHHRLYFAANKVFRSNDQGSSWEVISPDLTQQIDRDKLEVMGRVWPADAVSKNKSTSIYGNIVALSESPLDENLLYAGTDDGLVQVTTDGGLTWQRAGSFPGIPPNTYVSSLLASRHEAATVYVSFDNHKNADFKPYILKSTDRGKTWERINADIPDPHVVYCLAEDHIMPGLLFAGTEFGVFCSTDDGKHWTQMKQGLPAIAVRDIDIQRRENDLVLATFGRGFYILDDYSPLRHTDPQLLGREAHIFPIKETLLYTPGRPLGGNGKGSQGAAFYTAPNPDFGAIFSVYLRDGLSTRKQLRRKAEKKLIDKGEAVPFPSWDSLRAEDDEKSPYLLLEIRDEEGRMVRALRESGSQGLRRFNWDLRDMPPYAARNEPQAGKNGPSGQLVSAGRYSLTVYAVENGIPRQLAGPEPFVLKALDNTTMPLAASEENLAFRRKAFDLSRDARAMNETVEDILARSRAAQDALQRSWTSPPGLQVVAVEIERAMLQLQRQLEGDKTLSSRDAPTPHSILDRIGIAASSQYYARTAPTQTMRLNMEIAEKELQLVRATLQGIISGPLDELEKGLDAIGAPHTPGRGLR